MIFQPFTQGVEPKVHSGFKEAFDVIWGSVYDTLVRFKEEDEQWPNLHFFFTGMPCVIKPPGHSLGGALATLAAVFTKRIFYEVECSMYNFGSPRVGNHQFAKEYNEAVPDSWRLVNDRDVITGVPKFFFVFKHIGCALLSPTGRR